MNEQGYTNSQRAALLRALADDLEGFPVDEPRPTVPEPVAAPARPALAPEGSGHPREAVSGGVFVRDFWQVGFPGAMRGASAAQYEAALIVTGWGGGTRPKHTKVLTAGSGRYWNENMRSAADVGWVDGSQYRPPEGASASEIQAAWIAAGCPSESVFGRWGGNGKAFVPFNYGATAPRG